MIVLNGGGGGFGVNNNAVSVSEISLSTIFLVGCFLLIRYMFPF